jgi:uncharacterized membrane protein YphA (DoxX/SURF4 family)
MDYLFILGRILLGGYFVMSGINHFRHLTSMTGYAHSKNVPMPKQAVMLTGLMLLLGGLGILFWSYVTYAVYILILFLLVVSFKMHQFWKIQDPMQKMSEQVNFMKNLALLGALLLFL